jgi:hypothetical protein
MTAHPVIASGRDIRLDLFRRLAFPFIFIDHVPTNVVSWFTVRNYGFSGRLPRSSSSSRPYRRDRLCPHDAARGLGARCRPRLPPRLAAHVAHIPLSMAFTAQIIWCRLPATCPR